LASRLVIDWHPPDSPRLRAATSILAEQLPADIDARDSELRRLGERLDAALTLWDPAGGVLATTGRPLAPPQLAGPPTQWSHPDHGLVLVTRLDDGRWLGVGLDAGDDLARFTHFSLLLGFAILLSAALCYPIARRITRRVEDLRRGVEGLGAGDLGSRVQVQGRDEVAALATQFNRAADRIEALVAGQRRMLASASHELRSPLARLRMAVELLADAAPQQHALASEAGRDIEELDALVGDLLLSSRLEARPDIAHTPVDLAALVADEATRAGASNLSSGTAELRGDPAALRRLIRNLLENARAHGEPPIEVTVEATTTGVRLVVEDRGPGVPEAERERIFAAFYRPAGHREGDGGVGLGLALVRQISALHEGVVRCEARPGGGSRFVVELPRG
ncbi:MAG TPA: HAMP domain-containing sensor histidine kinase, partial [Nannocystis sp.]